MDMQTETTKSPVEVAEDLFVDLEEALPEMAIWQNGAFKGNREIVNLLGGAPEEIKLDRKQKKIVCNSPIWIEYLYFVTDDYNIVSSNVRVSVTDLEGKTKEIPITKLTTVANKVYPSARIKGFAREIKFKSESRFRRPKIKNIFINGFSLADFASVSEKITEALDISKKLETLKNETHEALQVTVSKIEANEVKIAQLEEEKIEHERDSSLLDEEISEKKILLNETSNILKSMQQKEVALDSNIKQLSEKSDILNKEIAQAEQKIKELENNKNVFSDEFVDYIKESKSHITIYTLLALIPLIVIASCSIALYNSANNFLHRGSYVLTEVVSDFLLRVPFSLATISVAFLSWKICEKLISKCVEIHQNQRDLSKILVIAKETVFSSSNGLEISDELKFKERIKLKIQLIRSHLRKEIASDFDYKIEVKKTDDATPAAVDSAAPAAPKKA